MKTLYDRDAVSIMRAAEECSSFSSNRIEMIRDFARASGCRRIGIAHCSTFGRETGILKRYLTKDFEVFCVDCKYGNLKEKDLFGGSSNRTLCNPAGQADYLNRKDTDLNLSIGLCVGHDMIFNSESGAPVTNLFAKDFTNGNDTARAVSEIGEQLAAY